MTASERALRLVKAQSDELRAAYAQLLRALADDMPDALRYFGPAVLLHGLADEIQGTRPDADAPKKVRRKQRTGSK